MRTFILLLIASSSFGQGYVDLFRFTQAMTPQMPIEGEGGRTSLPETMIDANIPVPVGHGRYLLTGGAYEQFQIRFMDTIHLRAKTGLLKVGMQWSSGEKDTWMLMALPRFSSDGSIRSAQDMQWGGMMTFKHKKHERFNWQVGVYANTERSGPFVVPMVGWWWRSANERWESSALLPLNADVHYRSPAGWRMGTVFVSMVKSYQLHGTYFQALDPYMVKSNNEVFGYVQTKPYKGFILQLRVGRSIGRSIKLYANQERYDLGVSAFKLGDDRKWLNPLFPDGGVAQIRLIYRLETAP